MLAHLRYLCLACLGFLPALHVQADVHVQADEARSLQAVTYNHPGLIVDLGVGLWAWPLPMDYDGDGDLDLIVSCPDVPFRGTYFFENPEGDVRFPTFRPPVRIADAISNAQVSYVDGTPRVLSPGIEYDDFRLRQLDAARKLPANSNPHGSKIRANQWRYADLNADGRLDLIVGVGDWSEYGWDNAFDQQGQWTRGPLHGYVYWLRNIGSTSEPKYAKPERLHAGDAELDVYGMPSPNLADFDDDGDLDLLCGEFLDGFSYFENVGTSQEVRFARARRLKYQGTPLQMDLQMIVPTAIDWDRDGDQDLIVGDEDGRVALVENTGRFVDGAPEMLPPRYFQQQADRLKFGALVTPVSYDWDGDGDEDLVCGNTAGYVGWFENLDGGNPPRWAAPQRLHADGQVLRIMAGPNGSIQGPCEAKWGYTTLSVADWDHDELPDLIVNSIWGKVVWYRNVGRPGRPKLAAAQNVQIDWHGSPDKPAWNWWNPAADELATQWRTTPVVFDWNDDGLNDLVMLDHEGYLAWYPRQRVGRQLRLAPPQRIFYAQGPSIYDSRHRAQNDRHGLLQLNNGTAGASGRRKLCLADWDQDGRIDLLVNSTNVNFLRNVDDSDRGGAVFQDMGELAELRLAGHTTSPTTVDWHDDGIPDLLVGGEDGHLYYMPNSKR